MSDNSVPGESAAAKFVRERFMEALATENGDIVTFFAQQVVEQGIDPQTIRDGQGNTPAHFLAKSPNNYAQAIDLFAKKGYGVNTINQNGEPPLFDAVRQGSAANVAALLDAGANVYYQNEKNGQTALHIAAQRGDSELSKILLERGAQKDAVAQGGVTPALIAAQNNRVSTLAVLQRNGANLLCADQHDNTPLHEAFRNNNLAAAKWLLQEGIKDPAQINLPNKMGETPLHFAAASGDQMLVQLALHHGANPNAADGNGCSPLHIAAGRKLQSEKMREIAALNASIYDVKERGASAEIIDLLVRNRVELEKQDGRGTVALFYAIAAKNVPAVKALAEAGADVTASIPKAFLLPGVGTHTCVEFAKNPAIGSPHPEITEYLTSKALNQGGQFRAPIPPVNLGGGTPPAGKPNMRRDDRTM